MALTKLNTQKKSMRLKTRIQLQKKRLTRLEAKLELDCQSLRRNASAAGSNILYDVQQKWPFCLLFQCEYVFKKQLKLCLKL
jgi:hypothetical protein